MTAQPIPFRRFQGFLKQLDPSELPVLELELLQLLFPLFEGTDEAQSTYDQWLTDPLVSAVSPLIQAAPAERRPRRYAGYSLGAKRYYTVCHDQSGDDSQTLAHELRAYRDPIHVGMVEVVDLAQGCELQINTSVISLVPERSIAVLIHEPQRLPRKFRSLDLMRLPGLEGGHALLHRFPYKVMKRNFRNVIDLRFPDVREWFYNMFRTTSEDSASALVSMDLSPTTAYSRFHFENGLAPAPEDFWSMLPTLVNPDLGGGNPADTGGTLMMIGHWLRQHDVDALVYPSARADVGVLFENGKLKSWIGWDVVNFENSAVLGSRQIDVMTFVTSPWAWVHFLKGVKLKVAEPDSSLDGSFGLTGVINYWAVDYIRQVRALEIARSVYGNEPAHQSSEAGKVPAGLARRVPEISALMLRWIRLVINRSSPSDIEKTVLALQGLATPYDMYPITGRVLELWYETREGQISMADLISFSLRASSLLQQHFDRKYHDHELDQLACVSLNLEWLSILIECRSELQLDEDFNSQEFLEENEQALMTRWIDNDLRRSLRSFASKTFNTLQSGSDAEAEALLTEGRRLRERLQESVDVHERG